METKREPTRTLELCVQIKGKLKALANFVTVFIESELTIPTETYHTKTEGPRETDSE